MPDIISEDEFHILYEVGETPQAIFDVPFPYTRIRTDLDVIVGQSSTTAFWLADTTGTAIVLANAVSNTTVEIRQAVKPQRAVTFPLNGRVNSDLVNAELDRAYLIMRRLQYLGGIEGPPGEQGPEGPPGEPGPTGEGWAPVLAVVSDGDRRVGRLVDWVGGTGTKPATGQYLGPTGLVSSVTAGVNLRGPQGVQGEPGETGEQGPGGPDGDPGPEGPPGPPPPVVRVQAPPSDPTPGTIYLVEGEPPPAGEGGGNGWSPVLAVVEDGARRVQRVEDWTGGTTTKPATGVYVGPEGFVADIANAVDIRGAAGADGANGSDGQDGASFTVMETTDPAVFDAATPGPTELVVLRDA